MTTIQNILETCRTIAVVGLSAKTHRASYQVAQYMQTNGYRIIPVNPLEAEKNVLILGEKVYSSLTEASKFVQIDLVNCFRNSEEIPPIARETIHIAAKVLWMQLGILNFDAKSMCEDAGILVVQDKCLKIEHKNLLG